MDPIAAALVFGGGGGDESVASSGGGAVGGGDDQVFWENDTSVVSNYTITVGKNAGTFGPVTVANSVIVTIPNGSTWSIV